MDYRERFEEENKAPAIIKITDGVHCVLIQCPSFAYVEWLEDLLELRGDKQPIATKSTSDVKVRPVMFCKGKSIINGYKTCAENVGRIISLMDTMRGFGANVTLQYCPEDMTFTILTATVIEEAVFHEIKMFARGFLKAANITTTEER